VTCSFELSKALSFELLGIFPEGSAEVWVWSSEAGFNGQIAIHFACPTRGSSGEGFALPRSLPLAAPLPLMRAISTFVITTLEIQEDCLTPWWLKGKHQDQRLVG